MRASYPSLEERPEKRLVWVIALPDGQSCTLEKMWASRDPEVWYYRGGPRPLGPGEGPDLIRACGYVNRAVTLTVDLGDRVRLETALCGPGER